MLSVVFLLVFSLFLDSFYCVFVVVLSFLVFFSRYKYSYFMFILYKKYFIYLDSLGFYFMVLSYLLMILVLCSGICLGVTSLDLYMGLTVFLMVMLFLFFSCYYYMSLYIYFEFGFLMMVLFILLWGVNPERMNAVNYFIVYTLLGSLPLFIAVVCSHMVYDNHGSFLNVLSPWSGWFCDNEMVLNDYFIQTYVIFFFILAFMMKMPVFGMHLWLPKAHVEAPVFGSMLLAGMMLKVGVFGLLRMFMLYQVFFHFFFIFCLAIFFAVGLMILNLVCSRQFDLKSFVAYSSVVHMTLMSMSIWFEGVFTILGTVFLSFAHGLCSSGLFLGVKAVYGVSGTRKMLLNRGFLYLFPLFMFSWFFLCACNCSMPASLKFLSELFLIFGSVSYMFGFFGVMIMNVLLCGFYCMYLYLLVSHGKLSLNLKFFGSKVSLYFVYLILMYHVFLIYFYFLFIDGVSSVF